MRARDLADPSAVVRRDDDASAVVRRLVAGGWDGLVVVEGSGRPLATVSLAQVLRLLLPEYIEEDVSLASVYAERQADVFAEAMAGRTVGQVLPQPPRQPVVVSPTATLLEVATAMATRRCSVVAVVESAGTIGAIGAHDVLRAALPL